MEYEEDILLEAANALLLLSSSPPADLPPAATINLFNPHPLPPAAMPATSIENLLSVSLPSWGFHSRRSHQMGKLKRKQVEGPSPPTAEAATCDHRSPDTPLDLGAASDPYSSGSDGFPCSSEIRPFKRLRTGDTSVPEYDAHLGLVETKKHNWPPFSKRSAICYTVFFILASPTLRLQTKTELIQNHSPSTNPPAILRLYWLAVADTLLTVSFILWHY
ncbi:hypothetical protein M5K25_026942 [Dendrobium thyrsiflorum]|uniref:Uncharacterized protein n=1 Tax=Dendrobium thyrsiflorum TaxID=117978 RepID=A0ABD0TYI5_DENTH